MWEIVSLRIIALLAALGLAGGLRVLAAAIRGLDPETLSLPSWRRPRPNPRRESAPPGETASEPGQAGGAPIDEVVERFVGAADDLDAGALLALVIAALVAAGALASPERALIKPAGLLIVLTSSILIAPILLVVLPERMAPGREAALLGKAVPAVLLLAAVLHPLGVIQDLLSSPLAALAARRQPAAAPQPPTPPEPTASALHQVLAFTRATVGQVMTPRAEIVAVESGATIADLVQLVRTTHRSRYPIYRSNLDDLEGWVGLEDLLGVVDDSIPVDRFRRELVVVPESKPVFELAMEMRTSGAAPAIVVDEFGTVGGLVNLHDLLSGLVGEVTESDERPEFEFRRIDPYTWVFNPRIRIERVNELTGLGIPEGDYQTLAGFLLAQMRRIPLPHERLRWRDEEFEILAADSRRIQSVRLKRRPPLVARSVLRPLGAGGDGPHGD